MSKIRVAINGYGRIGRNVLRALYESESFQQDMEIVAINDLGDARTNAHLTKYDTVHGRFTAQVSHDDQHLIIDEDRIQLCCERDPSKLPWRDLAVDVVLECTGLFTDRDKAAMHLEAGAKKVIISAPAKGDIDATVVHGVNHQVVTSDMQIISNASCTTNCLAPIVKPLHEVLGIESGVMTTIHSYTNDQRLTDVYHPDLYRARAAALNMIPTKTGAAAAIGKVIPELNGRLDGLAVRVPTINVSLVDLTFIAGRDTDADEVNQIIASAIENDSGLAKVLSINYEPLVSMDFNHIAYSSNFDATQTRAHGKLVKVMSWYDNEWGFSNRMLDNARHLISA